MATKKLNYVSSKKVMSLPGRYNLILGPWSNGKSYATKTGCVEACYKNKTRLALIRRLDKENTDAKAENYFLDCPVEAITDGEYNGIVCYRQILYFAKYNPDTAKWIKGQELGRRFSLYEAYQTKSGVYQYYDYAIFEEFVTLDRYLNKEVYRLMRLISSIARNDKIKVFMLGNTITPICPYYREFQLTNLPKQKQNTVDTYDMKNPEDGSKVKIAVYMTAPVDKKNGMFFGNIAKEADGGAFHCEEHQHGNFDDIIECQILHTVVFCYEGYKFLARFLRDPHNDYYWYVEPKTTDIQDKTRTVGQLRTTSRYHTKQLDALSPNEKKLFDYMALGKIAYCDNLTGTLFLQALRGIEGVGAQFDDI